MTTLNGRTQKTVTPLTEPADSGHSADEWSASIADEGSSQSYNASQDQAFSTESHESSEKACQAIGKSAALAQSGPQHMSSLDGKAKAAGADSSKVSCRIKDPLQAIFPQGYGHKRYKVCSTCFDHALQANAALAGMHAVALKAAKTKAAKAPLQVAWQHCMPLWNNLESQHETSACRRPRFMYLL